MAYVFQVKDVSSGYRQDGSHSCCCHVSGVIGRPFRIGHSHMKFAEVQRHGEQPHITAGQTLETLSAARKLPGRFLVGLDPPVRRPGQASRRRRPGPGWTGGAD